MLRWFPLWNTIGWLLVVLTAVLSLIPAPPSTTVGVTDKVMHLAVYCGLALWFLGIYRPSQQWYVAGGLLLFGGVLEGLQGLTGYRAAEGADFLANAAGIALAMILSRAGLSGWCVRLEGRISSAM